MAEPEHHPSSPGPDTGPDTFSAIPGTVRSLPRARTLPFRAEGRMPAGEPVRGR